MFIGVFERPFCSVGLNDQVSIIFLASTDSDGRSTVHLWV